MINGTYTLLGYTFILFGGNFGSRRHGGHTFFPDWKYRQIFMKNVLALHAQ